MLALVLLAPNTAQAQAGSSNTPPVDQGATPQTKAPPKKEVKLPWRGTSLSWSNRATAQTLGLGDDYQSSNPYAEWFFSLRPRYYLWDGGDHTLSLRATLLGLEATLPGRAWPAAVRVCVWPPARATAVRLGTA